MARLDWGLRMPDTLPLDLLSDTENEQNEPRLSTASKQMIWFRNWLKNNAIRDKTS